MQKKKNKKNKKKKTCITYPRNTLAGASETGKRGGSFAAKVN